MTEAAPQPLRKPIVLSLGDDDNRSQMFPLLRLSDVNTRSTETKTASKNFTDMREFSKCHADDLAASKSFSTRIVNCSECRTDFTQKNFSLNQWTKPSPKCKNCVKSNK